MLNIQRYILFVCLSMMRYFSSGYATPKYYTKHYYAGTDYAGEFAQLRYTAKNHQLHISGERKYYDNTIGKMAYEPFTFSTGYSIKENVLTIDSFSYDGGYDSKYYKPVILYKQ